jgi:hypothetical protein
MWKIEIFPNENDPDVLDMQVVSTAEDMELASHVAAWIDWEELAKTFVVLSRNLPRSKSTDELFSRRFEHPPMPVYEDLVAEAEAD